MDSFLPLKSRFLFAPILVHHTLLVFCFFFSNYLGENTSPMEPRARCGHSKVLEPQGLFDRWHGLADVINWAHMHSYDWNAMDRCEAFTRVSSVRSMSTRAIGIGWNLSIACFSGKFVSPANHSYSLVSYFSAVIGLGTCVTSWLLHRTVFILDGSV